jgi:glycosyltransferase involved in cell wall biosynthesis
MELESVEFFSPEDFGNPYFKRGFRTFAKALAMRRAVSAGLRAGSDRVLVATNGEATLISPRHAAKVVIYGDASGRQLNALYGFGRSKQKLRARDRALQKLAVNGARFAAMSRWCAEGFSRDYKIAISSVAVVPPPLDVSLFVRRGEASSTLLRALFVGGDFRRKGGEVLNQVANNVFDWEFHAVTTPGGSFSPRLHLYHGLESECPELLRQFRAADAFVFPTTADCSPLAILEAMASGLPVITTAVGGITDMVEHETTGFIVPVGDSDAVIQCLHKLLDARVREKMGSVGRQRVEAMSSLAVHARQWRAFLED